MKDGQRRGADYLLLTLGAACLVLLSLPATGKVRAFRAAVSYLLNPVPYYGSGAYERLAGLPANAARLIRGDVLLLEARRRLQETRILEAELEELRRENVRLREALGMSPPAGRVVRWARIIYRDPDNWYRSMLVDAGAEDEVRINAPVLGIQDGRLGVVGRIAEVGPRTSKVLLLSDESSAAAGRIPAKQWEGLVQGEGGFRLRMNYLPAEAEVAVGDEVVTSPASAAFPPGLPVGTVTGVIAKDAFLAFQSVELTPAVSSARLREVMILEPRTAAGRPDSPGEARRGGAPPRQGAEPAAPAALPAKPAAGAGGDNR